MYAATPKVDEKRAMEAASRLRLAIVRTARRLRQEAGTDLGPALTAALSTIEQRGPLTPSEVAQVERIQRPTATRILARLQREGLIERTADPTDRRSSLVSVTRAGRELLRKLRSRKTAFLAQRLRALDPDEVAALERATDTLERMLEGERG
jgi:DNA-binding MarR family transcriptional regulator